MTITSIQLQIICCDYVVMYAFCISVLNSPPKLKDLYNLITPEYAAHWKIIGTLLGIEKGIFWMQLKLVFLPIPFGVVISYWTHGLRGILMLLGKI